MTELDRAQYLKALGKIIRTRRKDKKLTQVDFARSTKVSQATLSRIERGTLSPKIDVCKRFADALGISLGKLYEEVEDEVSHNS